MSRRARSCAALALLPAAACGMTSVFSGISRRERRPLAVLLALIVTGHLLKLAAAAPAAPPVVAQLFDPAADGDPQAHLDSIRRHARPLGAGERIDIDHAPTAELTRLPGIGPSLANRIVADRQSHGAFGSLAGLRRVRGMGVAMVARLAPHL